MNSGFLRVNKIKYVFMCLCLLLMYTFAYGQEAEFIWSEDDQSTSRILMSTYKNGTWLPSEKIIEDQNWNLLPTLGINSKNHKLAVWSMVDDNRSMLKYAINLGDGWQSAQVLSDQMLTNLAPVIVFDTTDVCWVFWSANNGTDDDIYMSRYKLGKWTDPILIHEDNDVPDILPEAGLDDAGNIWVSWQVLTDSGYVETGKSFETTTDSRIQTAGSIGIQQIQQLKSRSSPDHQISPPPFFKSLGRASFLFPNDKKRPTSTVQGTL